MAPSIFSEDSQQSISTAPTATATATANGWPEPIQRVQLLSESGIRVVPSRYVRPESERPSVGSLQLSQSETPKELEIPIIDMSGVDDDEKRRKSVLAEIRHACENWGFFQILNHGIPLPILRRALVVSQEFFDLSLEEKQAYANDPITYEGYGSRLGTEKGAILDWGDYFFFHLLPAAIKNPSKWPTNPTPWRETMEDCSQHMTNLGFKLLELMSATLDLPENAFKEAFGEVGLAFRVNFYPPCPQPELTLGLSPHSDPGGITILLQEENVAGLQVLHKGKWVTVNPLPGALIVNLGDQIQIMSNGIYKSVEHRAIVNRDKKRISIAAFFNPCNEKELSPLAELCSEVRPARYGKMTFSKYRSFIRRSGARGKVFVDSVLSPGAGIGAPSNSPQSIDRIVT